MNLPDVSDTFGPWYAWALFLVPIVVAGAAAAWVRGVLRQRDRLRREQGIAAAKEAAEARGDEPPDPPPDRASAVTRWTPVFLVVVGILAGMEWSDAVPVQRGFAFTLEMLNTHLFEVGDTWVTPMTGVVVLLVLVAFWWVSAGVQAAVANTLRHRDRSLDEGVVASLQRLVHYAIMAVGLAVGLTTAGVNLSALFAAGAVLGVGIGFGLQTLANNFISGLILLMERSIKPGDILTVEGHLIRVSTIGTRATIGRTMEDEDIIVPNSKLVENFVVNHSLRTDVVRARAQVGVSYSSDLDLVQRTLEKVARGFDARDRRHAPVVLLQGFGSSSVDFDVSVWVESAFVRPRVLSRLRHAIWKALHEVDVVIAFPQLDVHFDPDVGEAVRRAGEAAERVRRTPVADEEPSGVVDDEQE